MQHVTRYYFEIVRSGPAKEQCFRVGHYHSKLIVRGGLWVNVKPMLEIIALIVIDRDLLLYNNKIIPPCNIQSTARMPAKFTEIREVQ